MTRLRVALLCGLAGALVAGFLTSPTSPLLAMSIAGGAAVGLVVGIGLHWFLLQLGSNQGVDQ